MTPDLFRAATGCSPALAAQWADPVSAAMSIFEINTVERQAAFLGQTGHESGGFQFVREIWGPTPAQQCYEGRQDLGNTERGDGFKYRGRGLIQITGRANYQWCETWLCICCVDEPELLEKPAWAAESAGLFWREHGLNELADKQLFTSITRRINGGLNGLDDRVERYHLALNAIARAT